MTLKRTHALFTGLFVSLFALGLALQAAREGVGVHAADCSALPEVSCITQAGCTATYAYNCAVLPDAVSCNAQSGNGCSANVFDCSAYDNNPSACSTNSTYGCSFNPNNCSAWNGDQGTCQANGCTYDGDTTECFGTATTGSCTGGNMIACAGPAGEYTGCTGTYAICGNGQVEGTEQCDDGNGTNDDYCTNLCAINGSCGDNILQAGAEACDDGNATDGDYCNATCTVSYGRCGDGNIAGPEVCDGSNVGSESCLTRGFDTGTLGCNGSCNAFDTSACSYVCGDNTLDPGEACDDGNVSDGDYCSSNCTTVTGSCGDGNKQSNEACDDGNVSAGDYCSADCSSVTGSCGDSSQQSNEACDDGNAVNDDYCTNACTINGSCGDGVRQAGAEACDDGNTSSGDYCSADCTTVSGYCGDNIRQSIEVCDGSDLNTRTCVTEGYDAGALACSLDCQSVNTINCTYTCGDGNVDPGEQCDDGNNISNDYCTNTCQDNGSCGDGIEQPGAEQCDDGNGINDDYCKNTCQNNGFCRDSILQSNETCDDGNATDGDGCSNACQEESGWACNNTSMPSVCERVYDCGGTPCNGILDYDGHTYYRFKASGVTWSQAEASCEGVDGYLATITDSAEQYALTTFTSGMGQFWIGLTDASLEGTFAWVTGEVFEYANWAPGQPDNAYGAEDCTELNHSGFTAGTWNDTGCSDTDLAGYICEVGSCGDGKIDLGEQCDDDNVTDGDGCSASCAVEAGYSCSGQPSACAPMCGDGVKTGVEECDDGNTDDTDGCSSSCALEAGWECNDDSPNVCSLLCGNGSTDAGEECDDGNNTDGDGCSALCLNEVSECGNGSVDAGEECDDGNTTDGDGCSASCTYEFSGGCGDNVCVASETCSTCSSDCGTCNDICDGTTCNARRSYDNHAYYRYISSAVPYNTAENTCVENGGHLVSVTSAQETSVLHQLLGNVQDVWIGLRYTMSAHSWLDGSPYSYTNWFPGADANEPCVFVSHSGYGDYSIRWADHTCGSAFVGAYVCEYANTLGTCGDGTLQSKYESCDDGNTANGDGCDAQCNNEAPAACGNGTLDPEEECDDGDRSNGDGCSSSCAVEDGWSCDGSEPSVCLEVAAFTGTWTESVNGDADGRMDVVNGSFPGSFFSVAYIDSASVDQTAYLNLVQVGWNVTARGVGGTVFLEITSNDPNSTIGRIFGTSVIAGSYDVHLNEAVSLTFSPPGEPVCGNTLVEAGEECDDGDISNGDGCSAVCAVEDGYACDASNPSVCTPVSSSSSSVSSGSSSSASSTASSTSSSSSSSASSTSSSSSSASTASESASSSLPATGGGRGARDTVRAPAEGRSTGVMSNDVTETPIGHPSAPVLKLRDVRASDPVLPDIKKVMQKQLMTGYKDAAGRPTGVFGAADPLTYDQVAKIAVKLGGLKPVASGKILSTSALGQWSEPYVRAAEQDRLPGFQGRVDVHAAPTKGDVLQTLLKASGIAYGKTPADALRKASELGLTTSVQKRALSRRDTALIISKLLNLNSK